MKIRNIVITLVILMLSVFLIIVGIDLYKIGDWFGLNILIGSIALIVALVTIKGNKQKPM